MLLKRIEAKTLAEALQRARAECGDHALVVETRPTRRGYLIVAAAPAAPTPAPAHDDIQPRWTRGFRPLAARATAFGLGSTVLRAVENALIGTRLDLSGTGDPALPAVATRVLSALIPTRDLNLPDFKVTALVGPTGVGKTTTLAKLAAAAVRERQESVAIVTIDTYRMAAVEQLRSFAELLGVPFEVAFTPQDLRRAVARHAGCDRIWLDTSGRSPLDRDALAMLRGQLEPTQPAVVLCLAAHARRLDALSTLSAFSVLGLDGAIITKWDETTRPGEALSIAIERGLALTHVTLGQRVPEDIAVARGPELAAVAFAEPDSP